MHSDPFHLPVSVLKLYWLFLLNSRREFDFKAEQLSRKLKNLDKHVTSAVVDQISDVFADAEFPIHSLLSAATAPLLVCC
mgnify:CR=1 FL=1